jgi:hypothetical protein
MTIEEKKLRQAADYAEAMRYMDNAKETLQKAKKQDDGWYTDVKYVRTACGTAYLGVLIALDTWLSMKGVEMPNKKKHMTIDFYLSKVVNLDKKMLDYLNTAYNMLHLEGYYRKEKGVGAIGDGFKAAYLIIDKIKPENPVDVPDSRRDKAKRIWNKMIISLAVMFRF